MLGKRITFIKLFFCVSFIVFFKPASAQSNNTLTAQEKKDGWKLLFNGKDLTGWHSYLEKQPGSGWQVKDGAIFINENDKSTDNIDLTTNEEFENFDLKLQ